MSQVAYTDDIAAMSPKISAIVALGKDTRAICKGPDLLWRIPEDLKRVRDITMGHTLLMGRKTYDSIGHPLRGRTNIIITRSQEYKPSIPGAFKGERIIVVNSSEQAISIGLEEEQNRNPENPELFIFGGGEIYEQTIKLTNRLYLTLVDSDKEGTSNFPEYKKDFTNLIRKSETKEYVDESGRKITYEWMDLERPVSVNIPENLLNLNRSQIELSHS